MATMELSTEMDIDLGYLLLIINMYLFYLKQSGA